MGTMVTEWVAKLVDEISAPANAVAGAATNASGAVQNIGDAAVKANDKLKSVTPKPVQDLGEAADSAGDRFQSFIKKLGLVAIALQAFSTIKNIIADGVQGYEAMQESQNKLAQVMRNTMSASNDEIQSIVQLTAAQEKLGVVSQTAQIAGAQELSTYLERKESLQSILPVMNDMLAQQYGLNATQEQAVGIATMLGKVMDGQVGALSRYGYKFDEAQEQILKFGTEAQRAAVLADVVGGSVGGMNEALAQTPEGKIKKAEMEMAAYKDRVGGVVVAIKNALLPAFRSMAAVAENVVSWVEANKQSFIEMANAAMSILVPTLSALWTVFKSVLNVIISVFDAVRNGNPVWQIMAVVIGAITAGIAAYNIAVNIGRIATVAWTAATSAMTAAQWMLNAAMNANPIGIIITAVAALVGIIYVAIKKYEDFGAMLLMLLGPIGLVVNAVMAIKRNWDSVVSAFEADGIIGAIKRIGLVLLDAVLYPVQQLLEALSKIPGVGKYAASAMQKLADLRKGLDLATPEKDNDEQADAQTENAPQGMGPLALWQNTTPDAGNANKAGTGTDYVSGTSAGGTSGRAGNKTITMNVTNNFNGFKATREIAEAVADEINNRLSDSLAVI